MEAWWLAQATVSSKFNEAPIMAAVTGMANRPSPWLERGCIRVEGVEQSQACLCARAIDQWLSSGGATWRQRSRQQWQVQRCTFAWLGRGEANWVSKVKHQARGIEVSATV